MLICDWERKACHMCVFVRNQARAIFSQEVPLLGSASVMASERQTAAQSRCRHPSTTFQGSNASQTRITCVSCRQTMLLIYHHLPDTMVEQALQRRARARGASQSVTVKPPEPEIPECERVSNRSDDLNEQAPKTHIQVSVQVATHQAPEQAAVSAQVTREFVVPAEDFAASR